MSKYDNTPINTVRISARDQDRLMSHINQPRRSARREEESQGTDRRGVRVSYQVGPIVVNIANQSGDVVRFSVVPRNLATRGMAFIHGQFLYPGTTCHVSLATLAGETMQVGGTIRDCRHVRGLMHEVSVIFHEGIQLDKFIQLNEKQHADMCRELGISADSDDAAKSVKSARTALVFSELESDRTLYGTWLHKLGMQVNQCGDHGRAMEAIKAGSIDFVVIDLDMTVIDALKAIVEMRSKGFAGPIIGTSGDEEGESHAAATAAGCSTVVAKPCTRAILEATIKQLCDPPAEEEPADAPIHSIYAGEADMQKVLASFMTDVQSSLTNLQRAMRENDATMLTKLCKQLKVSATSYGYGKLADSAAATLAAQTQADAEAMSAAVESLIAVCQRVRAD